MFGKSVDQKTLEALYSRMTLDQLQSTRSSLQQQIDVLDKLIADKVAPEV